MDDESVWAWKLAAGIVIALLVWGIIFIEPAPTHLCPRDYFDAYGRCP